MKDLTPNQIKFLEAFAARTTIKKILKPSRRGDFSDDVCGRASRAAASVLANHWEDAMKSGSTIFELLPDIDQVLVELASWKNRLCNPDVPQSHG